MNPLYAEIDRLRAALEFIAGRNCPPHGLDRNCVKDGIRCSDCLAEYARGVLGGRSHEPTDTV